MSTVKVVASTQRIVVDPVTGHASVIQTGPIGPPGIGSEELLALMAQVALLPTAEEVQMMITAAIIGSIGGPDMIVAPEATSADSELYGAELTCNEGLWTDSPTSFTYLWVLPDSGNAPAPGVNNLSTYTPAEEDSGTLGGVDLWCIVTAINDYGATPGVSNRVTIPALDMPEGDLLDDAIPIEINTAGSIAGDTTGATPDYQNYESADYAYDVYGSSTGQSAPGGSTGRSRWYKFTPESPGMLVVTITGTGGVGGIMSAGLYNGYPDMFTPGTNTLVNESQVPVANPLTFTAPVLADVEHYLQIIDDEPGTLGIPYIVEWELFAVPNDLYADAIEIDVSSPGTLTDIDLLYATGAVDEGWPYTYASGSRGVWYKFTPDVSGVIIFDTIDSEQPWVTLDIRTGPTLETSDFVYHRESGDYLNDDYHARACFLVESGVEYRIRISDQKYDGEPIENGHLVTLSWLAVNTTIIPGDMFADAIPIDVSISDSVVGTTVDTTIETMDNDGGYFPELDFVNDYGGRGMWFVFTPAVTGEFLPTVTWDDPLVSESAMRLFTGTDVHDLTEVPFSGSNGQPTPHSANMGVVDSGTEYHLHIQDGYGRLGGSFVLSWDAIVP